MKFSPATIKSLERRGEAIERAEVKAKLRREASPAPEPEPARCRYCGAQDLTPSGRRTGDPVFHASHCRPDMLAGEVWTAVFELFDGEIEFAGDVAGAIATAAENAVRAELWREESIEPDETAHYRCML